MSYISGIPENASQMQSRGSKLTLLVIYIVMVTQMYAVDSITISKNGVAQLTKEEQRYQHGLALFACNETLQKEIHPPSDGQNYCSPAWDGIMCWNFTLAGTVGERPCPSYVNGFLVNEYARRICTADGEWQTYPSKDNRTWTNFSMCLSEKENNIDPIAFQRHLPYLKIMYTIGYGISFVSLVLAIFVMIYFKKLHCTRNTIHINLFLSFILHALCNFLRDSLFVRGVGFPSDLNITENGAIAFIEEGTHWQCKLLITFTYYSFFTAHMWIFMEAVYLCVLLFVAVFSGRNYTVYYIVLGWATPLLFMIPWIWARIKKENDYCWNKHQNEGFFWIINAPITLIVVTNFCVFLAIVWFLLTKLKASNTPESRKYRYRKLARSTLVLIPLFGVYYIFTVGIPQKMNNPVAEVAVLYINLFFNSYQGFVVAMLFCFLNGEVRSELKKKISRLTEDGIGGTRTHRPTWTTVSTYVSKARNSLYSSHSTAVVDRPESILMNGSAPAGRNRSNCTLNLPSSDNFSSIAVVEQTKPPPSGEKEQEIEEEEVKCLIIKKEENIA